jgi:mannose-1-phosphate guanylyltransferase / mannose-6-phosphate isomerase
MKITPVILCGGSGTRLWPLSRQHFPKQFLKLVGDATLFQQSVSRAIALENDDIQIEEILIVTNEKHRFLVLEQLDELKINLPTRILLEPEPKNTAPALTLAAFAAQDTNSNSVLIVTPADHYVKDLNLFIQAMHEAIQAAGDCTIVTLGINPTRPDTGFGYIYYEGDAPVKNVLNFKEKPTHEVAKHMIEQGQHSWNGGMFILKSKTWLDAIEQSNPEIFKSINKAWKNKNMDQWFVRPDAELFKQSSSDSIDYAVMEKVKNLNVNVNLKLVVLNAGWSDLGSFDALDEIEIKDKDGNIFKGDVVTLNTKNTIAIASKKNISLLGVENLIVIETADSVLVANRHDAQSIKNLVKLLEKNHEHLLNEHMKVNRPWGWFETVDKSSNFKVKRIQVNPGAKLSYQSHQFRNEHWVVVKGIATIICDEKQFSLNHNESTYIKMGVKHQLINQENEPLEIIEVQTGTKVAEEDIQRFNDDYGRN